MRVHHVGERTATAKHQILPLAHIAEVVVVQENHLDWCLLLHDGTQLLDVHLETAISEEATDSSVWRTESGTDGSRKSEAHGSETTTGHNGEFLGKLEVTATDHLVLTDIVDENSLIMSNFRHHIGHLTHQERSLCRMDVLLNHLLLLLLAIVLEGISPLTMNILVQQASDGRQTLLAIAYYGNIGLDDLVDFRRVDVEMDNLRLLGIFRRNARDTVAESHTDGDEHITLLGLHVGSV
ncbi:unknown [Prevotella sp. CAG:732]|nr:unknown [Prevotella sp. CAG:732]